MFKNTFKRTHSHTCTFNASNLPFRKPQRRQAVCWTRQLMLDQTSSCSIGLVWSEIACLLENRKTSSTRKLPARKSEIAFVENVTYHLDQLDMGPARSNPSIETASLDSKREQNALVRQRISVFLSYLVFILIFWFYIYCFCDIDYFKGC